MYLYSDGCTGMLARGFTTVRDVGGANKHFKDATAQWLIPGPRLYQGGPVMSQTGGHGDSLTDPDGEIPCCQITPHHGGSALGAVADGRRSPLSLPSPYPPCSGP